MPDAPDISGTARDAAPAAKVRGGWLGLFLVSFIIYAATANRGTQWQDSGFHILRSVTGQSLNPLGLALSHPLHHGLARSLVAIDLFEPSLAVTLISALAAAVAVANVFGCVLTLTRTRKAALVAALSLGLAHTFWQLATVAETYTFTAALLAGECWCIALYATSRRQRFLWLAVFINGLGVSNHMLAALTTPVLTVIVLHGLRGPGGLRSCAVAAALWLLGSLPYSGMVIAEMVRTGDVLATMHSALFGHRYAEQVLNTALSLGPIALSLAFVALNFPNLLLPLACVGLGGARRIGLPTLAYRALLAGLIIHACFVFRYDIKDQHTFFLPVYVFLTVFGGVGFAVMGTWPGGAVRKWVGPIAIGLLVLTPAVYAAAPRVARSLQVLKNVARNKPYRDDYVYLFTPWSVVETSAERMSNQAVELAGDRGLIIAEDPMAVFAIRYKAIRAGREDLNIETKPSSAEINRAIEDQRPVVIVPKNRDAPQTEVSIGGWRRVGDLYVHARDPDVTLPP